MIKSFIFENFKSFEKAELNLEALTSLIGTNSSGKSNAIEGIHILADTATGLELGTILDGTRNMDSHIRGGSKSCCRFKTSAFKLGCLIDLDEKYDLYYYIKISTNKKVWVEEEALYKVVNGKTELAGGEKIFKTKLRSKESGDIQAEYNDKKAGRNPDILCMRVSSVLAQLRTKLPQNTYRDRECFGYIELVLENLKKIFILNPVPSDMRDYVRITDTDLKENCENISAVLRHLCEDSEKKKELLKIVSGLPENEIKDIGFITTQLDDVIFALREKYINSSELFDAKKLSDGTLRFIAIVAAILTIPEGSTLVIEEIDNGIHASRVQALIKNLSLLGEKRKIDIILTTHNPVLLNGYKKQQLLGVSVVYRENEKGTSKFIPFVDIRNYPQVFVRGGLGEAMLDESLLNLIKCPSEKKDYSWMEDF